MLLLVARLGGSGRPVLGFGRAWRDYDLGLGSLELLLRRIGLNHDERVLRVLALRYCA